MTFKQLKINQRFEFKRSEFPGLERGPWIKTSARGYRKDTNPFSADLHERLEHQEWSNLKCTVGSINVEVDANEL